MDPSHPRRQPSLQSGIAVLIDVCVPYLLKGQLPIMDLTTDQRSVDVVDGHLTVGERGAIGQRR